MAYTQGSYVSLIVKGNIAMTDTAKLVLDGQTVELPVVVGTENEKGIDVTRLQSSTGYLTLDPGYANTGACKSAITFIDGDQGILRYRGYDIAELCEKSTFMEVCYLLIHGELPTPEQFTRFKDKVLMHSLIHEDMKSFFTSYPGHAHPMAILSSMVCSLSVYHPELLRPNPSSKEASQTITRLLSKVRVLAAFAYKRSVGEAFVYTRPELDYVSNFMHMMFSTPMQDYVPSEAIRKALDVLFILHAYHAELLHLHRAHGRIVQGQSVRLHFGRCLRAVGPAAWRRQPVRHRDAGRHRPGRLQL